MLLQKKHLKNINRSVSLKGEKMEIIVAIGMISAFIGWGFMMDEIKKEKLKECR